MSSLKSRIHNHQTNVNKHQNFVCGQADVGKATGTVGNRLVSKTGMGGICTSQCAREACLHDRQVQSLSKCEPRPAAKGITWHLSEMSVLGLIPDCSVRMGPLVMVPRCLCCHTHPQVILTLLVSKI